MTNPITQLYEEGQEEFEDKPMNVKIVGGVEGYAVYINDFRVCGNKPWGGGTLVKDWNVTNRDLGDDIKSHHKHATLKLLRAVKEGVGEDKKQRWRMGQPTLELTEQGYNTAKAEVRQLLDEAITEIENL